MPLGFEPLHPGGMADNSPMFQHWGRDPLVFTFVSFLMI